MYAGKMKGIEGLGMGSVLSELDERYGLTLSGLLGRVIP